MMISYGRRQGGGTRGPTAGPKIDIIQIQNGREQKQMMKRGHVQSLLSPLRFLLQGDRLLRSRVSDSLILNPSSCVRLRRQPPTASSQALLITNNWKVKFVSLLRQWRTVAEVHLLVWFLLRRFSGEPCFFTSYFLLLLVSFQVDIEFIRVVISQFFMSN